MSEVPRISPEEAKSLLDEGHTYVDVRTEAEFEAGHIPGAYNVPVSRQSQPNTEFVAVMSKTFDKARKLIVGCQSGSRSRRAVELLVGAGYSDLRELRTGFAGSRDAFGRPDPGWSKKGFPIETGSPPGHGYRDLAK